MDVVEKIKINETTDRMSKLDEKLFAQAVKQTTTKDHSLTSLREIIKEARNEEQKEDRDKKVRPNNKIIHGISILQFTVHLPYIYSKTNFYGNFIARKA